MSNSGRVMVRSRPRATVADASERIEAGRYPRCRRPRPRGTLAVAASRIRRRERAAPARGRTRLLGFTTREHCAALVVFAAVTFAFFFPLVLGDTYSDVAGRQHQVYPWAGVQTSAKFTVLHYDQDDTVYPWQVFMSRELRAGHLPLWNPYSFGGTPFFANGQSRVLYPPLLALSYTVSPVRVHDLLLVTHLFLAGVAMFVLLGYLGLSFPAALIGGLSWMLNSFALAWQALEHYVVIEAGVPLGVLLAHLAVSLRFSGEAFWVSVVVV